MTTTQDAARPLDRNAPVLAGQTALGASPGVGAKHTASGATTEQTAGWPAVVSVAMGTFVLVTSEFLPIGLLTRIAGDLGVTPGTAGLVVTVPGVAAAISAPLLTVLARNADRRILLLALIGLVLLSNVISCVSGSLGNMLVGRILLGVGVGGFWTFATSVGRRLVPTAGGARATTIILTGVSVGTVLGVPIGTVIGDAAGWRVAFVCVAVLGIVVLFAQWMLLPPLPTRQQAKFSDFATLLRVPSVKVGFSAAALIAGGHFVAYTYLEPFLRGDVHLTSEAVSTTLAAYGVAGILGTMIGEKLLGWNLKLGFSAVALLASVAIAGAAAFDAVPVAAAVLVVIWGAAFGAVPLAVQLWTYHAAPDRFEAGSALLVTIFQIALAGGALIGGRIVDAAGARAAFSTGSGLALFCAIVIATGLGVAGGRK